MCSLAWLRSRSCFCCCRSAKVWQAFKKCMCSLGVMLPWLNSRVFFFLSFCLCTPWSDVEVENVWSGLVITSGFAQLLQSYHRMRRLLVACGFLPQLYSDLAVRARRTLQCGFRLFYWTCHRCCCPPGVRCSCSAWLCLILISTSVCTPTYIIYAYSSMFQLCGSLPRAQAHKQSTLFYFFFFNTTPLGKLHSADGWVTAAVVRKHKVPAVHSFPRHRWKLLALRPALIFSPW